MKNPTNQKAISLQAAIERTAAGVIEMQDVFDDAYDDELRKYEDVLRAAPSAAAQAIVAEIMPARQRISHSELEFGVAINVERSTGFSIQARILNLGYERRYATAASDTSRLKICVEQVLISKEGKDG